ncbi:caspase recruitment domain-containing protein 19 isoform X3 [Esox lucius]|uniref:Caspase recruitment domain-containing protein 19 n=1 Tax=Esox lucius TaxID=8010 RepID=A0AAY5KMA8_ESOLU|nr:caspase recruitment domain-containing protein 19 isoform X3 [Esox lucius]
MAGSDGYHEQLQRDSQFLCSEPKMHTELVDRLVLQLNRIYPQILTDKEAQRFRNLSVPTEVRLAELLVHLQRKGEEACHEFYRGLQIHADEVYFNLPTRVSRRREHADPVGTDTVTRHIDKYVLNNQEGNLSGTSPFLGFSALGLGSGASEVLLACKEDASRIQ